jgi:hypothetical protein
MLKIKDKNPEQEVLVLIKEKNKKSSQKKKILRKILTQVIKIYFISQKIAMIKVIPIKTIKIFYT